MANQTFQISWVKTQSYWWGRHMPFGFCGKISLQTFRVLACLPKSHIPAPHLFHAPTSFVTWRICVASHFSLLSLSLPRESLPQTVCVRSTHCLILPQQVTFSFSQYNGQKTSLGLSVLLWVPWTLNIRVFKSHFLLFVLSFAGIFPWHTPSSYRPLGARAAMHFC